MIRTMLSVCIAGCCLLTAVAARWESTSARPRASGTPGFEPLTASAPCVAGGIGAFPDEQPFLLPTGYVQRVLAREGDGGATDNWDMNTLNETGPLAGQFLFRSHETPANGQVSVTDLQTGLTRVLVERADWNRMDGIVWTPWQTLLTAEEMRPERQPSSGPFPRHLCRGEVLDQPAPVVQTSVPS